MPDAGIHRLEIGRFRISFREAPLTLATLAALVPSEINAHITAIDENVQTIPFDQDFDVVGISCLTGTAHRGYSIADRFRGRGSTVVLGGIHPTLRPEEAAAHADAVVIGCAEKTWPRLLRDWADGTLRSIYRDDDAHLVGLPRPRRDLIDTRRYMSPNTVSATRGCKRFCDFCTIPALPAKWAARPVCEVVDEIRQIHAKRIVFNDVSLLEDREYAKALFTALIPLKKKWGGLAPVEIARDEELLGLMKRSGCIYILVGLETIDQEGLLSIGKSFNKPADYENAVSALHRYGITVQGCFILGLDSDDRKIFSRTVEAVNDLKIDIPRYALYTPYPETRAFRRLKKEGRILHEYWPHYDTQHVVFQPANMSPAELDEGFRKTYEETFKSFSVVDRLRYSPHAFVSLAGNFAYRLYLKRLSADTSRIYGHAPRREGTCLT